MHDGSRDGAGTARTGTGHPTAGGAAATSTRATNPTSAVGTIRSAAPADPVRHRPGDLPPIPAVSAVPAIPTVPGVTTVRSTTTGSAPLHVPTTTCATLAALA